jgi:hypothetical protein
MAVLSSDGQQVLDNFYTYQSRAGEKLLEATREVTVGPREIWIPTLDPKYQLSVRPDPESVGSRASARQPNVDSGVVKELLIRNQVGTLATVSGLDEMRYPTRDSIITPVDPLFDRRFLFIPAAKLLITIPPDQGRLVLRRLDLEGLLERPLRILRGEKPGDSKTGGTSSSHVLPGTGVSGNDASKSGGVLSLLPGRGALLLALTLVTYVCVLALAIAYHRRGKGRRPRANAPAQWRILSAVVLLAIGLTLACVAIELTAYRGAMAAESLIEARMADPAPPALTLKEVNAILGLPGGQIRQSGGQPIEVCTWKGIVRSHTLRVECAPGSGDDLVVVSFAIE